MRIQSVEVKRNAATDLLVGQFHAVHLSVMTENPEND
jgi:hypothetical protein